MGIKTKNIYDPPSPDDGWRLLVMRKWPRGVSRQAVDAWDRGFGPSLSLLGRYRRGGLDWDSFAREYEAEVLAQGGKLQALAEKARQGTVTLLCGCRDEARCHRSLLKRLVEQAGQ